MINNELIHEIKNRIDLLDLVSEYVELKRVASTGGGEWAGPCPKCGGEDRFRLWPYADRPHFWCRASCGLTGDCFRFAQEIKSLTFPQAVRWCADFAGIDFTASLRKPRHNSASSRKAPGRAKPATKSLPMAFPPNEKWQTAGRSFVVYAQECLWSETGKEALGWLRGRGLKYETIRSAGVGYNPTNLRRPPSKWGVTDKDTDIIWLPRGWVFPWEINGNLWRAGIRRHNEDLKKEDDSKTIGPKGYAQGLYLADDLGIYRPVILVEGEITALTIKQEAGDFVVVVATGGTTHARRANWIAKLLLCPLVLVAFDNDGNDGLNGKPATKGNGAARWWIERLPNAERWRPLWDDANSMLQAGADVRTWVIAGLEYAGYPIDSTKELVNYAMKLGGAGGV